MTPTNPTDASKRAREMAERIWVQTSDSDELIAEMISQLTPLYERIDELEGALKLMASAIKPQRQGYVLGFLFRENRTGVVLIRKNKPKWQEGLLNGVGGKIELGETPEDAMSREFHEETGVLLHAWSPFCQMSGDDFIVHCFKAFDSDAVESCRSQESEPVEEKHPDELTDGDCVSNLHWLINLAIDDNYGKPFYASVRYSTPFAIEGLFRHAAKVLEEGK